VAKSFSERTLVGLVRARDHCTFTWSKAEGSETRKIEVRPDHCLQCLAEIRRRGFRLVLPDGQDYPA
jgi:hypothetical protein